MNNDNRVEFAARALDRILGFFPRIDGRAQLLMGIDVAMLYTLAVNVPQSWGPWWADLSFASAAVLLGFSLFNVYRVFFPVMRGPELSLTYFQEIAKLSQQEYIDRFTAQTFEGHTKDVLAQVWRNSEIVSAKFRSLRDGMVTAGIALPFWAFALAFTAVTQGSVALK